MAVEVPAVTRRVKRAAHHARRASRARMRASSPRIARIVTVSVPPAHDRHARATAALARSIDRARGVALAMAVKEAVGYTACHVRHEKNAPCRGVKNVFSVFFLESNTDRNTRIFLAVAVAYFAYFGPYFRIGGGRGKLTAI